MRHLYVGEKVKYLQGPIVFEAIVTEDLEDGVYWIKYKKNGVSFSEAACVNRLDLYTDEDTEALVEDLRGVIEDAEAAIEQLQAAAA